MRDTACGEREESVAVRAGGEGGAIDSPLRTGDGCTDVALRGNARFRHGIVA